MLTIKKATRREIDPFNRKEWDALDIEHYGKQIEWKEEKFYKALGFSKIAILPKHHFERDFVIYEKFIE